MSGKDLETIVRAVLKKMGVQSKLAITNRQGDNADFDIVGSYNDMPFEGKLHLVDGKMLLEAPRLDARQQKEVDYFFGTAAMMIPQAVSAFKKYKKAKKTGGEKAGKASLWKSVLGMAGKTVGIPGLGKMVDKVMPLKQATQKASKQPTPEDMKKAQEEPSEYEVNAIPEEEQPMQEQVENFLQKEGPSEALGSFNEFIEEEVDLDALFDKWWN